MKTLKSKIFICSITTLLLTGCMPDSLTQYKKDPPKKEEPTVAPPEAPKAEAYISPTELAYTNKQVITVNSNSMFLEGETIIQPITPPLTDALVGKVIKKIGLYRMAIETFNGTFSENASLDNNNSTFQVEKANIIPYSSCTDTSYITKETCEFAGHGWAPAADVHYNLVLVTDTTGKYVAGDTITATAGSGAGATGRVVFVESGVFDTLYVKYLTGTYKGTSAAKTFYEGDTLKDGVKVDQVINSTMSVTVTLDNADKGKFVKGSDIVSDYEAAAYTNTACASNVNECLLSLSEISKTITGTFFKKGHILYNHETQAEATTTMSPTITKVTHNNYFIFERGKNMVLSPSIATGGSLTYTVSPALPGGLTIDSSTGVISGAALMASAKKDYLITASNLGGSSTHVMAIEVKDFFEIVEKSGASSALMHKVGDFQVNRKCRVEASDITSLSNGKALDLRCFLDMEEEDLYEVDVKLNLLAGPNICQYVRYEPYYFYSWQPHQTTGPTSRYPTPTIIRTGCDAKGDSGEKPTADLCEGNYQYFDDSYPNCDEGKLTYYTESYNQTDDPVDSSIKICTLIGTTKETVDCGGKRTACISGAVRDVMSADQLALNARNEIISTSAGLDKTYTHSSPIKTGDGSNQRIANGSLKNMCLSSRTDTLAWKNATAGVSNLRASPFAYDSNPYYTVTCLNAAYDIKARIRVVVREWNKTFRISDDVFNQSTTGPTFMNTNDPDPIFSKPYNDIADWDDDYNGSAPAYTSCATQAAHTSANCTPGASSPFVENADCISAGGVVNSSAVCSNPAKTTYIDCLSSNATWTPATCAFANQNQCEYYGGTWTGPQQYKFPQALLINLSN